MKVWVMLPRKLQRATELIGEGEGNLDGMVQVGKDEYSCDLKTDDSTRNYSSSH